MPREKHTPLKKGSPPKKLPTKAWGQGKPPGGELPEAVEPHQNPAPPPKATKSPDDKK